MKLESIEIKDKLNRTFVLRNAMPDDADELIQFLKVTAKETPYLLREPDEVTITQEQEVSFVNRCLDSERSLMVIAILDGKLVGSCSINPVGDYKKHSHRCEVGIAIYQEFCNCGIGKSMLENVLRAAKKAGFEPR